MPAGILIADDSPSVRRVIRDNLIRKSFHVCGEAEDGEEAIEKARVARPDLVILDLAMPRTNGYVAASVLRDLLPKTRIILFTMYSEALGKAFGSKGLPVDAVVAKSEGITKLTDCVQSLLASGPVPA
jgi:DNA-binding NarL/FixJ family response regulator